MARRMPRRHKNARFRMAVVKDIGSPDHVFDMDSPNPLKSRCGLVHWDDTVGKYTNVYPDAHHDSARALMIQVPPNQMCKLCRASICKEIWRPKPEDEK